MYMKWSWNIVSKAKGMVGYSQGCGSGGFEGVVEEDGGGFVGERRLPLLRLIKTAPTFLLNHQASQRTKHFYQCLFLGKQ